MDTTPTPSGAPPPFRRHAADCFYHANPKGTGSALKIELHPAHDDIAGCVFLTMAMQRTIGTLQGENTVFPTFDWGKSICVKLDRTDLSQILQVLRGMQESIQDGRGLFHRSAAGTTVIRFAHQIEPRCGYTLSLWRKPATGGEAYTVFYVFDMNEAFTLMLALEQAILYVCFGIPEVIPRPAKPVSAPMETASRADSLPAPEGDPF